MKLTNLKKANTVTATPAKSGDELGNSFFLGAIAMCRLVYGFFYAYLLVMVGVLGGCKACRFREAVYQPDTFAAQSLVTFGGDFKNHSLGALS